ncbi:PQQ-dependent sugar dehydrogenase [Sabulicella glaciei]|uniref:PQQ-dependent sugar dehydrogenase n=1 Tax=Sabulicella glaciei TaxID=2984948 RepID=A0ABT3NZF7_9PROT|nr:PQQ-dependent sugar dehydrogenase [Roseococcus sp. MDT2-1-1]MCW8086964.1 PQQ-dependent sugar dehydrogenase [Roseococcus sp. MDT2-1-1]
MIRRRLLGLAAAVALPGLALAQQQQPAPPAWAQGRPAEMANSPLAPHAPRLTVTPPDRIPVNSLRVPEGFQVELWAHGLPGARAMARGPNGTIFVGTRGLGRVYAVKDNGQAREVSTLMSGLDQPSGVAVRDGALYIAAMHRVLRIDNVESNLQNPQPTDLTSAFGQATEPHHGWKHIAFGPDGRLYIPRGVPCNVCEVPEDRFALIESWNPDGSDRRIEARGVRNSVGFDFHPRTGQLWFSNHGRDWAGNNNPSDTLHVSLRRGENHGFPWCAGGFQDPAVEGRLCSEFPPPALILGPHVAPIGTHFYTGTAFPEQYRNALFIALRGSWNRAPLSGFEVIAVREGENGRLTQQPFLTGFRDDANQRFSGRPAGLLTLPDGSLLVSDEDNGAIYRVSYRR